MERARSRRGRGRRPAHLLAALVLRLAQEALRKPAHLLSALVGKTQLRGLRVHPPLAGRYLASAAGRPPGARAEAAGGRA